MRTRQAGRQANDDDDDDGDAGDSQPNIGTLSLITLIDSNTLPSSTISYKPPHPLLSPSSSKMPATVKTSVPSQSAVLMPETLLKKTRSDAKAREEKISKAAELKKVRIDIKKSVGCDVYFGFWRGDATSTLSSGGERSKSFHPKG